MQGCRRKGYLHNLLPKGQPEGSDCRCDVHYGDRGFARMVGREKSTRKTKYTWSWREQHTGRLYLRWKMKATVYEKRPVRHMSSKRPASGSLDSAGIWNIMTETRVRSSAWGLKWTGPKKCEPNFYRCLATFEDAKYLGILLRSHTRNDFRAILIRLVKIEGTTVQHH